MPKPEEFIDSPLTPDDIERYFQLKDELIKPLQDELMGLEIRFKGELPVGNYPSKNGYVVKRWEQIGALKESQFTSYRPAKQFPELYSDQPIIEKLLEQMPPETHPDLYIKVPNVPAIKEALNEEEKLGYFRQAQYLKITKKKVATKAAVPNFEDEDADNE